LKHGQADDIDELLSDIITYSKVEISQNLKNRIFNLIYNTYYSRAIWLSVLTRSNLTQFIDEKSYIRIKNELNTGKNDTEKMVHTGNIVAIIHGMLDAKHKLLTDKEQVFWKKKFIEYAQRPSETNGVLKRHSLHALAYFKDVSLISKVANNFNSPDSLVRDAFLDFCIQTDPNSKIAIDYFIKGTADNKSVYAQMGIQLIKKKASIKYFLEQIVDNDKFIEQFFKYESDENGKLIGHLRDVIDKNFIPILKRFIVANLQNSNLHFQNEPFFMQEVVFMINEYDPEYLFQILDQIYKLEDEGRKSDLLWNYRSVIAQLLTPLNVEQYFKATEGVSQNHITGPIYYRMKTDKEGKKIYKKAVKLGKIAPLTPPSKERDYEKERKEEIYHGFLNQLRPAEGKYIPNVFPYYIHHKKEIQELWSKDDKKRLIKLALEEGIDKIEPRQFKVEIANKSEGNNQFTWSAVASYFGSVLQIVDEFVPAKIKEHKQKIIDFIPYSFSHDFNLLLNLISDIKNEDLRWINEIMLDKKKDTRYLIPSSYIYFVSNLTEKGVNIPSAKDVLISFLKDEDIRSIDKQSALEKLEIFLNPQDKTTYDILKKLSKKKNSKDEDQRKLGTIANALLIKVFHDEKEIDWRFAKIKIPLALVRQEGMHTPSEAEMEIDYLYFAKPLIELKNKKYLAKFLEILQRSIDIAPKAHEQKNWDYVQYLWNIVFSYADQLKEEKSIKPYLIVQSFVESNATEENTNWLWGKIYELRIRYISFISVSKAKYKSLERSSLSTPTIKANFSDVVDQQTNNAKIDYLKKQKITFKGIPINKTYDIFISHASGSGDTPENEKKFVNLLYDSLKTKEQYKYKVFLDRKDNPNLDPLITEKALKESNYTLFVCSKRFINRWEEETKSNSFIKTEVAYIGQMILDKNDAAIAIAILFRISRDSFREHFPSLVRIFQSLPPFEAPNMTNSLLVESTLKEILPLINKRINE